MAKSINPKQKNASRGNPLRGLRSLLASDTLWNMGSLGIMAVSGLVLVAVLRYNSTETLGIFNQVYAIFIIISQMGVGGIQFSTLKHISYNADNLEECADITITGLLLVSLNMIVISLALWWLAGPLGGFFQSSGVAEGLRLAVPGVVLFSLNKVLINVVNGLNRMKANSVFRALRFVILPVLVLIFIILDLQPAQFAAALTLTEAIVFVALLVYVYTQLLKIRWPRRGRYWLGQHFAFGARGLLSGVLLELNTRVDVIMLGYFTSDALVGVYSFASTVAEGFGQIPIALRWRMDPQLGEHFSKDEPRKIEELSQSTRQKYMPWILAAALLAVAAFPALSWLVDGRVDQLGWLLFAIMMIGVTASASYRAFGGILLQGGRPALYTAMIIALVVGDALLNLGFIPWLGVIGAAMVTSLTYSLEGLYLRLSAQRFFGIKL